MQKSVSAIKAGRIIVCSQNLQLDVVHSSLKAAAEIVFILSSFWWTAFLQIVNGDIQKKPQGIGR